MSGYNTRQELATLQELGLQFGPDIIVLNMCLNDSDPVKRIVHAGLENQSQISSLSDINARTVVASSFVLTFLKENLVRLFQGHRGLLAALNSPTVFLDSRIGEGAWQKMKADMVAIVEMARREGIPIAAVVYPYRSQVDLEAGARLPQQDLVTFFSSLGVPVLDIAPAYHDRGQKMFVDGYIHLSPEGHQVVAGVIHEFLLEQQMPPAVGDGEIR